MMRNAHDHNMFQHALSRVTAELPDALRGWDRYRALQNRRVGQNDGIEFDHLHLARDHGLYARLPAAYFRITSLFRTVSARVTKE